jgi:hypothetical protein
VKVEIAQIRMPNSECRKKSEARSLRRSIGTLGSPGKTQEGRDVICPGDAGPVQGTASDFGFRNSFGFRLSEFGFQDAKTKDFHN